MDDLTRITAELREARRTRSTVASLVTRYPDFSIADGYVVASTLARERVRAGDRVAGRKVGLTNPAQWAEKRTDAPIWGYVHDSTLVYSRGGRATVDLAQARNPRLEPEMAFKLARVPSASETSPEALLACIEWCAPCFELIDCHFEGWKFLACEGIADSGVHYRLVVGEPLPVESVTAEVLATCPVELLLNDEVVEHGSGANTLGSPLNALGAFVRILAADRESVPLAAGEVITTGTLTPPRAVAIDETWEIRIAGADFRPLRMAFA